MTRRDDVGVGTASLNSDARTFGYSLRRSGTLRVGCYRPALSPGHGPTRRVRALALESGGLIAWLIVGMTSGWFAGQFVSGDGYRNTADNMIRTVVAAIVGARSGGPVLGSATWLVGSIVVTVIGALIFAAFPRAASPRHSRILQGGVSMPIFFWVLGVPAGAVMLLMLLGAVLAAVPGDAVAIGSSLR